LLCLCLLLLCLVPLCCISIALLTPLYHQVLEARPGGTPICVKGLVSGVSDFEFNADS
jgi:hypothetical protein